MRGIGDLTVYDIAHRIGAFLEKPLNLADLRAGISLFFCLLPGSGLLGDRFSETACTTRKFGVRKASDRVIRIERSAPARPCVAELPCDDQSKVELSPPRSAVKLLVPNPLPPGKLRRLAHTNVWVRATNARPTPTNVG